MMPKAFVLSHLLLRILAAHALASLSDHAFNGKSVAPVMNVIVVGGSSGMGKAAAQQVLEHGGRVLLVSRSMTKLEHARQELAERNNLDHQEEEEKPSTAIDVVTDSRPRIEIASIDITDETQVEAFASSDLLQNFEWNGLVVTAAGRAPHGPIEQLPTKDTRDMMESKLWGAYHCAKHWGSKLHSKDNDGAAVVFCAGILNRRPGLNCAPLAMANGALEGLTRTLALQWGPQRNIRVNCLSPGFCDTERFDHMDASKKEQMLYNTAASLPLRKVGQPRDMGQAIYYLLTAPFCTGLILDVDGGHGIRQYANAQNDPMRKAAITKKEE